MFKCVRFIQMLEHHQTRTHSLSNLSNLSGLLFRFFLHLCVHSSKPFVFRNQIHWVQARLQTRINGTILSCAHIARIVSRKSLNLWVDIVKQSDVYIFIRQENAYIWDYVIKQMEKSEKLGNDNIQQPEREHHKNCIEIMSYCDVNITFFSYCNPNLFYVTNDVRQIVSHFHVKSWSFLIQQ